MTSVCRLAALGASLTLGACVGGPPPGPAALVLPGKDKTVAAFQQDEAICQQHAVAQTGYGDPSQPATSSPAGSATGAEAAMAQPSSDVSFMQCMAARGDTVQAVAAGYGYAAPYAYPYPDYGYPYFYPGYDVAFGGVGVFHRGFLFHRNGSRFFHHNGFHGGFHGGGFHGGGHGGHH
jgi:hypothetical protein